MARLPSSHSIPPSPLLGFNCSYIKDDALAHWLGCPCQQKTNNRRMVHPRLNGSAGEWFWRLPSSFEGFVVVPIHSQTFPTHSRCLNSTSSSCFSCGSHPPLRGPRPRRRLPSLCRSPPTKQRPLLLLKPSNRLAGRCSPFHLPPHAVPPLASTAPVMMEGANDTSPTPLAWHDFLECMRQPSAANFIKSIKGPVPSSHSIPLSPLLRFNCLYA
jgi:hypothetical protein